MISQIVLDPGVKIDDAWAARIADSFAASLVHSQDEITSLIQEALMAIPVWDASERIVTRCKDRIVKALGASCLHSYLRYQKKGRWTLLLVSAFLRSLDGRVVIETVRIIGKAIETVARVRGRLVHQRTIEQPSVVNLLELSRHAFERFIQRAGLHKPGDVHEIFRDVENLTCLSAIAFNQLQEPGESLLPLNTPKGRCALVVVRDEPYATLVAKTLIAPPFSDRQEIELANMRARYLGVEP